MPTHVDNFCDAYVHGQLTKEAVVQFGRTGFSKFAEGTFFEQALKAIQGGWDGLKNTAQGAASSVTDQVGNTVNDPKNQSRLRELLSKVDPNNPAHSAAIGALLGGAAGGASSLLEDKEDRSFFGDTLRGAVLGGAGGLAVPYAAAAMGKKVPKVTELGDTASAATTEPALSPEAAKAQATEELRKKITEENAPANVGPLKALTGGEFDSPWATDAANYAISGTAARPLTAAMLVRSGWDAANRSRMGDLGANKSWFTRDPLASIDTQSARRAAQYALNMGDKSMSEDIKKALQEIVDNEDATRKYVAATRAGILNPKSSNPYFPDLANTGSTASGVGGQIDAAAKNLPDKAVPKLQQGINDHMRKALGSRGSFISALRSDAAIARGFELADGVTGSVTGEIGKRKAAPTVATPQPTSPKSTYRPSTILDVNGRPISIDITPTPGSPATGASSAPTPSPAPTPKQPGSLRRLGNSLLNAEAKATLPFTSGTGRWSGTVGRGARATLPSVAMGFAEPYLYRALFSRETPDSPQLVNGQPVMGGTILPKPPTN